MTDKKNVSECAIAVAEAIRKHKELAAEKEIIESRFTDATNELNQAAREFDAAVKEFKTDAPRGTDWHREQNPPQEFRTA